MSECKSVADLRQDIAKHIMQVLILFALIAASQAAIIVGTGASSQYRSQDNHGNYAFGYNEGHGSGATFRKEAGSNGVVAGSYGLSDADGRQRVVNYVADGEGFRADIKTNEPGVEPKDPASTSINKAHLVASAYLPAAPAFLHAAPAIALPGYAPAAISYAAAHPIGAYSYSTSVGHYGNLGNYGNLHYANLGNYIF